MRDDFESLYAYDRWANAAVLDACRRLTPEQYAAEPVPGWSSVRSTVYHLAIVTEGWLRGVAGEDVQGVPSEEELATVDAAAAHLERGYQTLERMKATLTPEYVNTPKAFRGRGRVAVVPPWAVLRHVVNHGTYHRGQLASKLARLGVDPPATDMIYWAIARTPQTD